MERSYRPCKLQAMDTPPSEAPYGSQLSGLRATPALLTKCLFTESITFGKVCPIASGFLPSFNTPLTARYPSTTRVCLISTPEIFHSQNDNICAGHPCNMKEFKVFVGLTENTMTEVLSSTSANYRRLLICPLDPTLKSQERFITGNICTQIHQPSRHAIPHPLRRDCTAFVSVTP